jgi:hypothetical protein
MNASTTGRDVSLIQAGESALRLTYWLRVWQPESASTAQTTGVAECGNYDRGYISYTQNPLESLKIQNPLEGFRLNPLDRQVSTSPCTGALPAIRLG